VCKLVINEIISILPDIHVDLLYIFGFDFGPGIIRELEWIFSDITSGYFLIVDGIWVVRVLVLNIPIIAELGVYFANVLFLKAEPVTKIEHIQYLIYIG